MLPTLKEALENFAPPDLNISKYHSPNTYAVKPCPRTRCKATLWTSFEEDLKSASTYDLNARLTKPIQFIEAFKVCSEQDIINQFQMQIRAPFESVLQALGFKCSILSHHGLTSVGLDPNQVLFDWDRDIPLCVLEFRAPWAFPIKDSFRFNDDKEGRAVAQLHGYMSYSKLKYGILSNYDHYVFFCRTSDFGFRYSRPIPKNIILKVLVEFFFLIRNDSVYSATSGGLRPFRSKAKSNCLQVLEPSCYRLEENAGQSGDGGVMWGNLGGVTGSVIFKVKNICRKEGNAEMLQEEADVFYAARAIQGKYIPTLYAHVDLNGVFHALVFEDVGGNMEDDEDGDYIAPEFRSDFYLESALEALSQLHKCGFLHGDIAPRNLCLNAEKKVTLIDLGRSKRCDSQPQFEDEIENMKWIFKRLEEDN